MSLQFIRLGIFFWDPNPVALKIPLIHHPIMWYGVIFALGLCLAYKLFQIKALERGYSSSLVERLSTWMVLGVIFGSRLFHVLFYDLPLYRAHPLTAFKIWEGGLASHGGVAGALIALYLFSKRHKMPALELLDAVAPAGVLLGACIRLGNFANQEILGKTSTLPWAVVFGHPADGSLPVPRHPVQLYEALFYAAVFFLSSLLAKKRKEGFVTGFVLALVFIGRTAFETLKEPMSQVFEGEWLHMGTLLSLPIIFIGCWLMLRASPLNRDLL